MRRKNLGEAAVYTLIYLEVVLKVAKDAAKMQAQIQKTKVVLV